MKWFIILFVYILKINGEDSFIKVQRGIFIENNFWCSDQDQFKTDKGYLYKVGISLERKGGFISGFHYSKETCFHLKLTNFGYIVPRHLKIEEDINYFVRSLEDNELLLRFRYLFSDDSIVKEYVTYKVAEKKSDGSINFKCNESIDIRIKHIKERLEDLIWMKLLRFNEYIEILNDKKSSNLEDGANFDLNYFENYYELITNLKKVIEDLCYFKLLEDNVNDLYTCESSETSIDDVTTLKVSQFLNHLSKKNFKNLKELNNNEIDEAFQPLLDRCCDYIKEYILKNNIFLPIGGFYDINYYIEQLSNLIYEEIKIKHVINSLKDIDFIFSGMTNSLEHNLEKLQSRIIKDLFESEYIHNLFSELIESEVETLDDYIKVEQIVCDYYNMFAYITNSYYKFSNKKYKNSYFSYSYFQPIFNDNFNLKIIHGIKIVFKWPSKFGQIKGFNTKGEEIIIMQDIDYFIDEFGVFCIPSNILKMKNIYKLEVISSDEEKNTKIFNVNEYLNV